MTEISAAALELLVPDIYDAALEPSMWQGVVQRIALNMNAAGVELVNAGILLSQRWVLHDFPEQFVLAYVDKHAATDAVVPAIMAQATAAPLSFDFSSIPGLMETPLYEDIVKPLGLTKMCLMCLGQEAGQGFELIAVARGRRQKPFDAQAVAAVARLAPHLRSAGIMQMRLDTAGEPFRAALNGLSQPVAVLSAQGRVLFANVTAEALFRRQDGLMVEGGQLAGASAATTAALQGAIHRAIASQLAGTHTPGEDLALPRPSGRAPLALHIAPLGRDNPYWARGYRAAVGVFIDDPDRLVATSAERLRVVYGLTQAEARVALALAEGYSPAEIGERLGTRPRTVRTQLESVFAKLGVRRQSQAVQRVLAIARGFSAPPEGPQR